MKYTLDIDINNAKAKALLNYISTLDFVRVSEVENSDDMITDEYVGYSYAEQKALIKQDLINRSKIAMEQYKKGQYTTHEDLLKEAENW